MLNIKTTNKFEKDYLRVAKRGKKLNKIKKVITILASGEELPKKYKDHKLIGNYVGTRECHIEPDWLLIYKISDESLILERTGTHSDLFK